MFGWSWFVTLSCLVFLSIVSHELHECIVAWCHKLNMQWRHCLSVQSLWQNHMQCTKDLQNTQWIYTTFHSTSQLQTTPWLRWLKLFRWYSTCWTWNVLEQATGEALHCQENEASIPTLSHTLSCIAIISARTKIWDGHKADDINDTYQSRPAC